MMGVDGTADEGSAGTDAGSATEGHRRPTPPSERIVALDALRGFALLGILIINVRVFSMPEVVLLNPTAYGDFSGANYWSWFGGHLLAEGKFITLFTVLFGAGIALFVRNRERDGDDALRLHRRRTGWLVAIGLAHAYLLWYGDILVGYGVCALWVVSLRDRPPRSKALVGLVLVAVPSLMETAAGLVTDPSLVADTWRPAEAAIRAEIETYQGGWLAQLSHRVPTAVSRQTAGFFSTTLWRVSGSMLLGMALFETGVLTGDRSTPFYRRLAVAGGLAGLTLTLVGVWYIEAADWAAEAALLWRQFNYWGSFGTAAAYLAVVMLYAGRRPDGPVTRALAAVGRTALSNYLLQTLLATTVFYGHGLGLFGSVSRVEALWVVLAVWTVQVPLSVLWLRYFRFGPAEWGWRALTYRRLPPLRR